MKTITITCDACGAPIHPGNRNRVESIGQESGATHDFCNRDCAAAWNERPKCSACAARIAPDTGLRLITPRVGIGGSVLEGEFCNLACLSEWLDTKTPGRGAGFRECIQTCGCHYEFRRIYRGVREWQRTEECGDNRHFAGQLVAGEVGGPPLNPLPVNFPSKEPKT